MDYITRKLLDLTDESLIFNEDWLSRKTRHNRSVNMISGRLANLEKQCEQCVFSQCVKNGTYQTVTQLPDMRFICADAQSKKIIDSLPDRRLCVLVTYFMKYPRKSRLNVKFLVMDMNASYGQLLKTIFPNAEIVTDCFHIIQHINRTFNHLRIKEMNRLKRYDQTEAKQYRRLKR